MITRPIKPVPQFYRLPRFSTVVAIGIVGLTCLPSLPATEAQQGAKSREFRRQVRVVIPPQRPITNAPVIAANEVRGRVTDTELVLGVEIDGKSRAYPINMLTGPRREIINDSLGGRPIAATW